MKGKDFWKSKTLWIAALQGLLGLATALESNYPEIGWLIILKSLVDVSLRMITYQRIK